MLRTSTDGSTNPVGVNTRQQEHGKAGARLDSEENGTPASPTLTTSASPNRPAFTVTTPTGTNDDTDPEVKWMEERHRSLQKIKERKNARRGLSQVDERQAALSLSISRSLSHSRTPPLTPPLSPSPSVSHSPSPRQARHRQRSGAGLEKKQSRSRHTSGSGIPRGFTGNEFDLGVQSDTAIRPRRETNKSGRSKSVTRRDDDDVVLLGREARMSRIPGLGRDRSRQEREGNSTFLFMNNAGAKPHVEEDSETVSDKTLVHQ